MDTGFHHFQNKIFLNNNIWYQDYNTVTKTASL